MSEPLFMYDKIYRTRNGINVEKVRRAGQCWRGHACDDEGGYDCVWLSDGRVQAGRESPCDLMPGAIEDEQQMGEGGMSDELLKRVVNLMNKVEFIDDHSRQIASLKERVAKLEHDHGPHEPAKRTIKGGWANVYRYHNGNIQITPCMFRTRAECDGEGTDHRIACIQIPDIEEGEGL